MQELTEIKDNTELQSDTEYWKEFRNTTKEDNINRLLDEAEMCARAGALNSATLMLWSATTEKIKVMILFFSPEEIGDCRHVSPEEDINSPRDFEIEDKKLLDVAEDLGLIEGNEGVILQSIRNYVRNKCAHGVDVELDEDDLQFLKQKLLTCVFQKTDRAGITPKKIVNLMEDGRVPKDMLESIDKFSESEQFEIANKIYDVRKEIPLSRMERRDNYLQREGYYSIYDVRKREAIKDSLDIIWSLLNENVRSQVSRKAKRDMMAKEGSIGFLMEYGISEFDIEDKEKILGEFLGERRPENDEHGNDVAINIFLCRNNFPKESSPEIIERVYAFSVTQTPYNTSGTIEYYSEFISSLTEENKSKLLDIFEQRIIQLEDTWENNLDEDWVKTRVMNSDEIRFLERYLAEFEEHFQTRMIDILSDSLFYNIEPVETKVDNYREEKDLF